MNYDSQINDLVKKGIFDERLIRKKRQKRQEKALKAACLTVASLIVIVVASFVHSYNQSRLPASYASDIKTATENKPEQKESAASKSLAFLKEAIAPSKKEPVNILVLGRPGKGYPGGDLTDTIILIHLVPGEKAVLISLPRDFLVEIRPTDSLGKNTFWGKINSVYQAAGLQALENNIEEITGLQTDHFAIVDLTVVKEIIKTTDGLNVYVPQDINDPYFPGPNYSYEPFQLKMGWRYLDGELALKYIRTRYTSPNGDFDRMARQQQILQLLKQKVLSLNPLLDLPKYLKIYESFNNNIQTDLTLWQIKDFWQIAKNIDSNRIIHIVIDKKETNLLTGGGVMLGSQLASVVYPKAGQGNYEEIRRYVQEKIEK